MSNSNRDLGTMNYHPVLFVSLIALQSIFSGCSDQQNPGASEVAIDIQETQKSSDSEAINAIPEIQKPSEPEAIEAAVRYLNRDGQLTIEETEFIAWGTFSEQQAYWPMKFRMAYKSRGSDTLRHNEYAVKISKDLNGKWKAGQYYAWRTDFK
jgi:hypothetical protein